MLLKVYELGAIDTEKIGDQFWKEPGKIITDTEYLSEPTEEVDLELGEKIAAKLINTLSYLNSHKGPSGIGLSANQIGINKRVFVTFIGQPKYYINPKIVETDPQQIMYKEECLSLPRKRCLVKRHMKIKISADNLDNEVFLGVIDEKSTNVDLLEAVCFQHEFNHLDGILMTDLDETPQPIKSDKQYGRNDKITIVKDDVTMEIKYKNYEKYKKDGWVLMKKAE